MAQPGESVEQAGVLARVHTRTVSQADAALARLAAAFTFSDAPVTVPPRIEAVITA
jgi:thymidine phosphorylase